MYTLALKEKNYSGRVGIKLTLISKQLKKAALSIKVNSPPLLTINR
jgi:hypothetical protein